MTYDHWKTIIANHLTKEDCEQLVRDSFSLSKIQSQDILKSKAPAEDLLLALENNHVIHAADVNSFREACGQTQSQLICNRVTDVYDRTRSKYSAIAAYCLRRSVDLASQCILKLTIYSSHNRDTHGMS